MNQQQQEPSNEQWKTLAETCVHDGRHLKVSEVIMQTPERPEKPTKWTVVRRKAAVGVAAQDAKGNWLLIRQERIPVAQTLWEFPAGQIDNPTDSAEETAQRELLEEAGVLATAWESLGSYYTSPGFTDEVVHLFLAKDCTCITKADPQGSEVITDWNWFSSAQVRNMVLCGEIDNSLTLALVARLMCAGKM